MKAATFSAVADGGTPSGNVTAATSARFVEFGLGRRGDQNGHPASGQRRPGLPDVPLRQVRAQVCGIEHTTLVTSAR